MSKLKVLLVMLLSFYFRVVVDWGLMLSVIVSVILVYVWSKQDELFGLD